MRSDTEWAGRARRVTGVSLAAIIALSAAPASSSAQSLGTFRWQTQPYCNVMTVTVAQQGDHYLVDGTDEQCGAAQKAAVQGLAFLNPDGTIGFGLNVVTSPGGGPLHVDATISLATLGGTWRDSAGRAGAFVFGPGAPGLPPPAGWRHRGGVRQLCAGATTNHRRVPHRAVNLRCGRGRHSHMPGHHRHRWRRHHRRGRWGRADRRRRGGRRVARGRVCRPWHGGGSGPQRSPARGGVHGGGDWRRGARGPDNGQP